jgi:DNA-nicking Smr family endonuclease
VKEKRDETFRDAMHDVRPLRAPNRVEPFRAPAPPVPVKRHEDERAVIEELARSIVDDDVEIEEDASYLRPGLPRDILRRLRRTHWVIQDDLDLHGLNSEEAALATARFLAEARKNGLRCVRIVHGKGLRSRGREPVLKGRIRKLLTRRDDVLAFVEPRPHHGGAGAVVVLLAG